MDTQIQSRSSSTELKDKIMEHIEKLAKATDAALVSEEMHRYLEMCARFHHYSPLNVWLILIAKPDATMVAGFKKWQSMKRFVRRGERGIPILAPILAKVVNSEGDEEEKLVGFKTVHVFDIAQTDGEPLPEAPEWKSPEKNAELQERLIHFAQCKGIRVEFKDLRGEIQGVSIGGAIAISPQAGTKTIIHEIAHELLHHVEGAPTESTIRELEAEAVAFIVGKHFGLEGLSSPNYLALHGADSGMILSHMERIRKTSGEIIAALEDM